MKAKTRISLILALLFVMAAALIGGCSIGFDSYDDIVDQYYSMVTYYGNGGYFGEVSVLYTITGHTENSAFYNIDVSDTKVTIARGSQYQFGGWYYIETIEIDGEAYYVCEDDTVPENYVITVDDEETVIVEEYEYEGETKLVVSRSSYEVLIMQEAKNASYVPILKLTEEVEADTVLPEGFTYVAAKWNVSQGIEYRLAGVSSITYTTKDGEEVTVNEGEVIYIDYYGTSSTKIIISKDPVSASASTNTMTDGTWLEEFYTDEACTEAIAIRTSVAKPDDDSNFVVYANYMSGLWTLLKDSSDVRSMFGTSGSENYYLFNDIDCSGVTASPRTTFGGTFEGNGYTISNLTVSKTNLGNSTSTAIFGQLTGSAVIRNVTFDNLTVTYTTAAPLASTGTVYYLTAYMICSSVASGADPSITNVTITNSSMNVTVQDNVVLTNMQEINGVIETDNYLYGLGSDLTNDTDAMFTADYGGVTLVGFTLTYNGTIIAEVSAE